MGWKEKEGELRGLLADAASPEEIVARVLRNLDVAYEKAEQHDDARLVSDLFTLLASHKDR